MDELKPCPLCGEPLIVRKSIASGEEHYVAYCHCGFEFADDCRLKDFIEECNRRAAQENKAQWIPVSERMPEELQPVLVYGETDNEIRGGYEVAWLCSGIWTGWWTKNITHWMPLPEPPEDSRKPEGSNSNA